VTHPIYLSVTATPADTAGVAANQTRPSAGYFTLNGTFVTGGTASFASPTQINVVSLVVDTSDRTFTITGTDVLGNPLTEEVLGSDNTTTSVEFFSTVSSVYVDGIVSGNVSIGTSNNVATQWVPFDTYMPDFQVAFYLVSATLGPLPQIEVTFDDVYGTWRPAAVPYPRGVAPSAFSFTGTANGVINDSVGPVTAARLVVDSSGSYGSVNVTFIQQGY
jgi:hypothetical protein